VAGTDGSATVNVTLLDNFPHPDASGQNIINLTGINVVATDTDGDQASATVQVNVTDDVPTLNSIQNAIVANTTGTVTGHIDVQYGADGPNAGSALVITSYNDLAGIVEVLSNGGQTLTGFIDTNNDGIHDAGETQEFFKLSLNDTDNTYTLTHTERPVVSIPLDFSSASGGAGAETLTVPAGDYELTFNGGIFNGTTLVDLGEGQPGDDNDDVKPTGNGFGIGDSTAQTTIENNEGFFVNVTSNGNPTVADALTFEIDRNGGGGTTTMVVNWRAFDADGNLISGGTGFNAGSGSQTFTVVKSPGTGFVTINPPGDFATMEVWFTNQNGGGNTRIDGVQLVTTVIPEDQPLTFGIAAQDGDGDVSAPATLSVLLQGGEGPGYTLQGTASDEIITGGSANDTICGGGGNDTVIGGTGVDQFRLATNTGTDIIKDYTDNTDKIGLLDTGSTGGGSVNFANTVGTSAGTALNATDFAIRASISALTTGDSAHVVQISAAQTSIEIAAATVAVAANTYVLVFNSTTGHGELWFDTDWHDTTGRTQVATFDNITALAGIAAITASDIFVYNSATDPIILDLNHDGFAFSDLNHGVQFDINGDGTKDQVAWNTSNDGMLAVDLNHDGKVDDGTELFTPSFGGGHFASGAAALASLDSNHDGVIDHNDAVFDSLLIWKDANANGISDAGELSNLAHNGITSISTTTTSAVGEIDGQTVTGNGTFQMADGTTGNYVEVELDTSLAAPAQPPIASDGSKTFAIGSLEVADLIADFHDGDKIDLSALLKGLAGVTDLVGGGFVEIAQSSANAANAEVKLDTNGGGDNYHTVAVLENYTFHSAADAVKILYDDSHGTKTDVA
ncbi:type I secretion C-terminal target domain-containing protein, partial [Mesorhizobium sp. M0139]